MAFNEMVSDGYESRSQPEKRSSISKRGTALTPSDGTEAESGRFRPDERTRAGDGRPSEVLTLNQLAGRDGALTPSSIGYPTG